MATCINSTTLVSILYRVSVNLDLISSSYQFLNMQAKSSLDAIVASSESHLFYLFKLTVKVYNIDFSGLSAPISHQYDKSHYSKKLYQLWFDNCVQGCPAELTPY